MTSFLTASERENVLPCVSKNLRDTANFQRGALIEKIHGTRLYPKGLPQLSYILKEGAEFQNPALTTTQKLNRLIQHLDPTCANFYPCNLSSLGKLNERATDTRLFEYAIRVGDLDLIRKFDPDQFDFFQTRDFFYFAAKHGDCAVFLALSLNEKIKSAESVLTEVLNDQTTKRENAEILITTKPHLLINRAIENATLKVSHAFLAIILKKTTATNFNTSFDPYAGMNDVCAREGLHSSLIIALDKNDMESFNQLLQLNPSQEILQHIRARALWINSQVDAGQFVNPGDLFLRDIAHRDILRTPFINRIDTLLN
jgi:hypothetical protein